MIAEQFAVVAVMKIDFYSSVLCCFLIGDFPLCCDVLENLRSRFVLKRKLFFCLDLNSWYETMFIGDQFAVIANRARCLYVENDGRNLIDSLWDTDAVIRQQHQYRTVATLESEQG